MKNLSSLSILWWYDAEYDAEVPLYILFCKLVSDGFNEKKFFLANHFVLPIRSWSKTRKRKRDSKSLDLDKRREKQVKLMSKTIISSNGSM